MQEKMLEGKVAIVSGASYGMGYSMAELFARMKAILPDHFLYEVSAGASKQYQILKGLMERSDIAVLKLRYPALFLFGENGKYFDVTIDITT